MTRAARTSEQPLARSAPALRRLGKGSTYHWNVNETLVDMAMPLPEPRALTIACQPQSVMVDLNRTALIVIDMQNDFCAKGGWVDHLGVDYTPDRTPIGPLQKLLPLLRKAGVPIIWVNWGNRLGSSEHAAQPDPPLQAARDRNRVAESRCRAAGRTCWRRTVGRPP